MFVVVSLCNPCKPLLWQAGHSLQHCCLKTKLGSWQYCRTPGASTSATGLLLPARPWLLSHLSLFWLDRASWGKSREIRGLQASSSSSSSFTVTSQDPGKLWADYIMDADGEKCKSNVILLPGGPIKGIAINKQSLNYWQHCFFLWCFCPTPVCADVLASVLLK